MNQIKQLEAQIASLDMTRRQLYGTDRAYQENSAGESAPLVDAPPAQADILGLDDFNVPADGKADGKDAKQVQDASGDVYQQYLDQQFAEQYGLLDRKSRVNDSYDRSARRSAALIGGLVFSGAAASAGAAGSGNATGPGNVRNGVPVPDNGPGGASAGNDTGTQARRVVNPSATYGYGNALGDVANGVYAALQDFKGAAANAIDTASIATMGYANALLDAPLSSIPGQPIGIAPGRGGPYYPEPWQTSTSGPPLNREEALQINGSFDMRQGRAGYGTDPGIPGQATPSTQPGTRRASFEQHDPRDLENAAGLLNMTQGGPEFATIAGEPVQWVMLPGPNQVNTIGPDEMKRFRVNLDAPQPSDAANQANANPTKFLKMFKENKETRQGIATRVANWAANAALTASTMSSFAADPVMGPYLANAGLNIQAISSSRGYGKRKRSAKSSFAGNFRGGRKKGRR